MIAAPKMRSPAPRANAEDRAIKVRNNCSDSANTANAQTDFATLYVARRYGLALPLARVVVGLASLGRAFT
jgi:hypothetical protein